MCWQVADCLASAAAAEGLQLRVETVTFQTRGDVDKMSSMRALGPGAFTAEVRHAAGRSWETFCVACHDHAMHCLQLDEAVAMGAADLAVHSLKDAPPVCHPGLVLGGCLAREDVRDAVLIRPGCASLGEVRRKRGLERVLRCQWTCWVAGWTALTRSLLRPYGIRAPCPVVLRQMHCPAEARWGPAAVDARRRSCPGESFGRQSNIPTALSLVLSPSRHAHLELHVRYPSLQVVPVRGSVEARLAALQRGDLDATVLALSGEC